MSRLLILPVCLLLTFPSSAIAETGWTTIRPPGGIVEQFIKVGDRIWARGPSLHSSADGGGSWVPEPSVGHARSIALSPHEPSLLLAGGVSAIHRSVDGGATWVTIALPRVGAFGDAIVSITFDAVDPNRVFAAASGVGIYASSDAGTTWAQLAAAPSLSGILLLAAHPTSGGVLYATGADFGMRVSTDGGSNWSPLDNGIINPFITSLTFDPADPSVMFAGDALSWRVYRTTDAGAIWAELGNGLPAPGSGVWATDIKSGATPGSFYATFGGIMHPAHTIGRVFKTTNGGDNWTALSSPTGAEAPQVTTVYPDLDVPGRLLIGTRLGNFRSDDDGATWTAANDGFNAVVVAQFAAGASGQLVTVSRYSGIHRSRDSGATWEQLTLEAGDADFVAAAISPHDADHIAVSHFGGPHVSRDGGQSWTFTSRSNMVLGALAFDPTNQSLLYAIHEGGTSLLRSADGGDVWNDHATGTAYVGSFIPTRVAASAAAPGVLFLNHHSGIYKSEDNGQSWAPANGNLAVAPALSVAVHPTEAGVVYASFGPPVSGSYRSDDGGQSWQEVWSGTEFGPEVRALAFDPRDSRRMLAAKANAVYGSIDAGQTWLGLNDGLDWSHQGVLGLAFDPAEEARYYVALGGTHASNLQTYVGAIATDLVLDAQLSVSTVIVGDDTVLQGDVRVALGYPGSNVALNVALPGIVSAQAAALDGGECTLSSGSVSCTIAHLPVDSSHAFTLTLRGVHAGTGQVSATVTSPEVDIVPASNSRSLSVTVTNPPSSSPPPPPAKSGGGNVGWLMWLPAVMLVRRRRNMRLKTSAFRRITRSGLILAAFLSSPPAFSGDREWTYIQPLGGTARHFAEGNGSIYFTSRTQVYRSDDRGDSWVRIATFSRSLLYYHTPFTVQGDVVLASAFSEGGLWRSPDRGTSWAQVAQFPASTVFFALRASPHGSIFGSTGSTLLESHDSGLTWTPTVAQPGSVRSFAFHPLDPLTIYVGTATTGVHASTDGGVSWTAMNNGLGIQRIEFLEISPDGSTLLAGARAHGVVYRSTDGGLSWSAHLTALPQAELEALAFDPQTPDIAFAGLSTQANVGIQRLYRSTNGGASWDWLAPIDGHHQPEVYGLHVVAGHPARIIIGTSRGLFISDDSGASWVSANTGFSNASVHAIAVSAADPGVMYATSWTHPMGGQDALYRSPDGGQSWELAIGSMQLQGTGFSAIAADPHIPGRVAVGRREKRSGVPAALYFSDDGGNSWRPDADDRPAHRPWAALFDNTGVGSIWALSHGPTSIYATHDGGTSWQPHSTGLPDASADHSEMRLSLARAPSDPDIWYAGTALGLYRSDDGGVTWQHRPLTPGSQRVAGIVVDPNDPDRILAAVTTRSGLHSSRDGGVTWEVLPFPGNVLALAAEPDEPAHLLAFALGPSNSLHVLGSIDAGVTWHEMSEGLTQALESGFRAASITFDPHVPNRYYVVAFEALQVFEGGIATDITLSAAASASTLESGATVDIDFVLTVITGHPATGIELAVSLPPALSVDEISLNGPACGAGSTSTTCIIERIAVSDALNGTITLKGAGPGTGNVTVTATAREPDVSGGNNQKAFTFTVTEAATPPDDLPPSEPPPSVPPSQPPVQPTPPPAQRSGGGSFGWWVMLPAAALLRRRRVA